jgi:hypothetical protein
LIGFHVDELIILENELSVPLVKLSAVLACISDLNFTISSSITNLQDPCGALNEGFKSAVELPDLFTSSVGSLGHSIVVVNSLEIFASLLRYDMEFLVAGYAIGWMELSSLICLLILDISHSPS